MKMLHTLKDSDDPPPAHSSGKNSREIKSHGKSAFLQSLLGFFKKPASAELDNLIQESEEENHDHVTAQERELITNILDLRDISVINVMVPRADITAIEVYTSKDDILTTISEQQHSRYPVYRETLDEVLGTVHIKDIVAALARDEEIDITAILNEIPVVSPSMSILDLMIEMKESSRHMALVVDEYGGIDGLITIGDVIETIVGQIDDEHDTDEEPEIKSQTDGSLVAEGRLDIETFEERYGDLLTEEEREESDTLGGLVFVLAGRVPARGEIISHSSGMIFEILDADPKSIKRLKIRNIPGR